METPSNTDDIQLLCDNDFKYGGIAAIAHLVNEQAVEADAIRILSEEAYRAQDDVTLDAYNAGDCAVDPETAKQLAHGLCVEKTSTMGRLSFAMVYSKIHQPLKADQKI